MTDLFKILQPLQFLETYLKKGSRPDGRKFDQFRNVTISNNCISSSNGSSLVKLGTSSVICGIKTSVVKPPIVKPDLGILDISVKFSLTCSTDLDNPDRTQISDSVRECLKKVLFHSEILNLAELCLIPGKFAHKLELEIVCLNLSGSILDLSLIAAICALKNCKLQKYEIDNDLDIITPTTTYNRLQLNSCPVFVTFSLLDQYLLVDPLTLEEELSDSVIRIALDPNDGATKSDSSSSSSGDLTNNSDCIHFLEITGSGEIDQKLLQNVFNKAKNRAKFIRNLIEKYSSQPDVEISSEAMEVIEDK